MAKATVLTPDTLKAPQVTPQAATPARGQGEATRPVRVKPPKELLIPLQVKIPKDEARAIKIAATQRDQTISQFMLACFHASMLAPSAAQTLHDRNPG